MEIHPLDNVVNSPVHGCNFLKNQKEFIYVLIIKGHMNEQAVLVKNDYLCERTSY